MSAYPLRVAAVEPAAIGADLAGRVLAAPVHALEDAPPFTRSSVDGFAVRAADVAAAKSGNVVRLTVAGDVPMGAKPAQPLQPGHAVRVPTGGFLPAGATGVVKKEDCRDLGDAIEVVDGAG
ncbi:MAG: molybdopterin molybdenumtransferase MoeA, partial [Candidatus Eremiobacteraeota bacterium]|nr:molybdopterin molybdenumtransferase MoeA [Candidatus Eremiobacteraeota bacterium]